MLNIKKYTDGRFFDTVNRKFLKPEQMAELIRKGEEFKVILTKTGKDITDSVIAEITKKTGTAKGKAGKQEKKDKKGDHSLLNTDALKKWVGEAIDKRLGKLMDAVNLPTKDQVAKLDKNIQELNQKIAAMEGLRDAQAESPKKAGKRTAAPRKKTVKPAGETAVKKAGAAAKKPAAATDANPGKPAGETKAPEAPEAEKPAGDGPVSES